jgi:replication-associated recombination protein RarA
VGVGKTAFLRYIIETFKGKGKVVYIDAKKLTKRLNIASLIKKKHKNMILLIDNVSYLTDKNNERIKHYFDQNKIRSVVFTTTNIDKVNFSKAIMNRIGKNVLKLKRMNKNEFKEILDYKQSEKEVIDDDVFERIYEKSENLKQFIAYCDAISEIVVEEGREKATLDDINNLEIEYEDDSEYEAKLRRTCSECGEELEKIGKYWRCRNCDQFCNNCGALCEDDDDVCPECGIDLRD